MRLIRGTSSFSNNIKTQTWLLGYVSDFFSNFRPAYFAAYDIIDVASADISAVDKCVGTALLQTRYLYVSDKGSKLFFDTITRWRR